MRVYIELDEKYLDGDEQGVIEEIRFLLEEDGYHITLIDTLKEITIQ